MTEVFNVRALGKQALSGLIIIHVTYKNSIPAASRTNFAHYKEQPVDATVYCPNNTKHKYNM